MFRKIALAVAGLIVGFGLGTTTAASAATATPTPVFHAHLAPVNSFYACIWADAAGRARFIAGPYAWDVQAINACKTMPHPGTIPHIKLVVPAP